VTEAEESTAGLGSPKTASSPLRPHPRATALATTTIVSGAIERVIES
jgi:hypothetical protein